MSIDKFIISDPDEIRVLDKTGGHLPHEQVLGRTAGEMGTGKHWHGATAFGEADEAAAHKVLQMPGVVQRMEKAPKLDLEHDVPYLAGYSKDGSTVYIDRHLPSRLKIEGKPTQIFPFLALHETIEKALIDTAGMRYEQAHQLATDVEHLALSRALGKAAVGPYEAALRPYIKNAEHEMLKRVPKDLDLTPYTDSDAKTLEKKIAIAEAKP